MARVPQHFSDDIARCLQGAFDLNCRCAPSTAGYSFDHIEAALQALALGLGGLVYRDDGYCTTPIAALLSETTFKDEPISLTGSVTLNNVSGGVNFYAAEHALKLQGSIVSMPTISAENHLRMARWPARQASADKLKPRALTAVDALGEASAEAIEIIEAIADRCGVLDAGCLHVSEAIALFREAHRRGAGRLLVSDPVRRNAAQEVDILEFLDLGVHIEFTQPNGVNAKLIRLVLERAPKQLILGLDTGPSDAPRTMQERYAEAITSWRNLDLDLETIAGCMSQNAARLIAIEPAAKQKQREHA